MYGKHKHRVITFHVVLSLKIVSDKFNEPTGYGNFNFQSNVTFSCCRG